MTKTVPLSDRWVRSQNCLRNSLKLRELLKSSDFQLRQPGRSPLPAGCGDCGQGVPCSSAGRRRPDGFQDHPDAASVTPQVLGAGPSEMAGGWMSVRHRRGASQSSANPVITAKVCISYSLRVVMIRKACNKGDVAPGNLGCQAPDVGRSVASSVGRQALAPRNGGRDGLECLRGADAAVRACRRGSRPAVPR